MTTRSPLRSKLTESDFRDYYEVKRLLNTLSLTDRLSLAYYDSIKVTPAESFKRILAFEQELLDLDTPPGCTASHVNTLLFIVGDALGLPVELKINPKDPISLGGFKKDSL